MEGTAALYLAHLNPMTRAHESIVSNLKAQGYHVYVFPVRFLNEGREVNTRSFPFSYDVRKQMVESVFGSEITVLPDYTFNAPYSKYLPPVLSSRSWELRRQILSKVGEKEYVSYTGDPAERLMLKIYRLNPLRASRLDISASSVKELLYHQALKGAERKWTEMVPAAVAGIIDRNWDVVERFANAEDATTRVLGMKFPQDGFK